MPGVTAFICWSAIPLPVKNLSGGQPADRCATEEGGLWASSPWLAIPGFFPLPISLESLYIVS